MFFRTLVSSAFAVFLATAANADQAKIQSALSAGPDSLTKNATIMD